MANTNSGGVVIEKVGKFWRAQFNGVTICSCYTKASTKANADYLMNPCSATVWADIWYPHQCSRKAIVERDGAAYCKVHDPVEQQRRRDARSNARGLPRG